MSLRHGLLGMLNTLPMTGYDLHKEFRETLGYFWHVNSQQVYKELDAMEKNGWLVSERVIQNEKPNKRVYSITAKGKAELASWLSEPEEDIKFATMALKYKNPFLMRLVFAGEASQEQALDLLRAYRQQCLVNLRKTGGIRKAIAKDEAIHGHAAMKYWKLTALHGEIMRNARLEWVEKALEILEGEQDGKS